MPDVTTSTETFGFRSKYAKDRYARMGKDALANTLGPMPVEEFLLAFLPCGDDVLSRMPPSANAFDDVKGGRKEPDIYLPLQQIKALNEDKNPANPRGSRTDDYFLDPPSGVTSFDTWTFVLGRYDDADNGSHDKALENLGQSVRYAALVCARQYRNFCFSLTLAGEIARFIRWDHAGAIVSEAFSILAEPELLCEFFWRFAHVSDSARGYDLTVSTATVEEERRFHEAIKLHVKLQLPRDDPRSFEEGVEMHYMPGFVASVILSVLSDDGATTSTRKVFVSRPLTFPFSTSGRGTRAYWAVELGQDPSEDRTYALKDTWRLVGLEGHIREREGDVLLDLHRHAVPNIPPLVGHGDVPLISRIGDTEPRPDQLGAIVVQETVTDKYLDRWWVCGLRTGIQRGVARRIHYRMLLGVAGLDLMHISGSEELLRGAFDAFLALRGAHDLAHRLHRDINPGNIILYWDNTNKSGRRIRRGYLIDWDQSSGLTARYDEYGYYPSLAWLFLSYRVANGSVEYHKLTDDMESFLYVVLYCGLLRLPHDLRPGNILWIMRCMLGQSEEKEAEGNVPVTVGGRGKAANHSTRMYTQSIVWGCPGMQAWITAVCDFLSPNSDTPPARLGKWNTPDFEEFWRTFLENTTLSFGDCVNHIAAAPKRLTRSAPPTATGKSHQATASVGSKRRASSPPPQSPPKAKRPRFDPKMEAHGPESASSSSHVDAHSSNLLAARQRRPATAFAAPLSYATVPPSSYTADAAYDSQEDSETEPIEDLRVSDETVADANPQASSSVPRQAGKKTTTADASGSTAGLAHQQTGVLGTMHGSKR
ncbi:hypothetical protein C8Q77DRAFT_1074327 [Trametes polyzona]|nr:hypothetical protein C8Q77DRAFT_1074327 [Trametes polyzona]